MKNILILIVIVCFGCSGKKIEGKYKVTAKSGDESIDKMIVNTFSFVDITMDFKSNGDLLYITKVGGERETSTFKWAIKNDSLYMIKDTGSEQYYIQSAGNGYILKNNDLNLSLTKE